MNPRHPGLGTARCLLALACALGVLWASPAAADRGRDIEFVRKLRERGWLDLAEDYARKLEQDAKRPPEVRGDAAWLLVDIYDARERAASDPAEKETWAQRKEEARQYATREYADHGRALVAEFDAINEDVRKSRDLRIRAGDEKDPAGHARLVAQAEEGFGRAAGGFERVIASLEEKIGGYQEELRAIDQEIKLKYKRYGKPVPPELAARKAELEEKLKDPVYKRNLATLLLAGAHYEWSLLYPGPEGKEAREEKVARAMEQYRRMVDEFYESEDLVIDASLGLGKCLADLGKYDEAVYHFGAMTQADMPSMPWESLRRDEREVHDRLQALLKDRRLEAYYRYADAMVRWGGHDDQALRTLADMEKAYPDALENTWGKLALLEKAKALVGRGDGYAGFEVGAQVVDESRRGEDRLPGYDIGRVGYTACRVMSELYDRTVEKGGRPGMSARHYLVVGQGYFFRQEFERAVSAFQDAAARASLLPDLPLVATTGDVPGLDGNPSGFKRDRFQEAVARARAWREDRRDTLARALLEMGNACFTLGQLRESDLAFELAWRTAAPGTTLSQEAVSRWASVATRLRGEGEFENGRASEAQAAVAGSDTGGSEKYNAIMRSAEELKNRGRWREAAEGFASVPPQVEGAPYEHYHQAQVLAGYCWAEEFKSDPAAHADSRARAVGQLRSAIAAAQASGTTRWWAAGLCYLADLHLNPAVGEAEEAARVLEAFAGNEALAMVKDYGVRAAALEVTACLKAAKPARAEDAFARLEKLRAEEPRLHERAALELGIWFDEQALTVGAEYQARAARYIGAWLGSARDLEPAKRLWAAGVVLKAGDRKALDQVILVYDGIEKELGSKPDKDEQEQLILVEVEVGRAEVLALSGQHEQAVARYRELAGKYPESERVLKGLADTLMAWYEANRGRDDGMLIGDTPGQEGAQRWYEKYYGLLNGVDLGTMPAKERLAHERKMWECQLQIIRIYEMVKLWAVAGKKVSFLETMGKLKTLPFDDIREELLAIKRRCDEKTGGK